jgi:hypothetical protein
LTEPVGFSVFFKEPGPAAPDLPYGPGHGMGEGVTGRPDTPIGHANPKGGCWAALPQDCITMVWVDPWLNQNENNHLRVGLWLSFPEEL